MGRLERLRERCDDLHEVLDVLPIRGKDPPARSILEPRQGCEGHAVPEADFQNTHLDVARVGNRRQDDTAILDQVVVLSLRVQHSTVLGGGAFERIRPDDLDDPVMLELLVLLEASEYSTERSQYRIRRDRPGQSALHRVFLSLVL